MSNEGDGDPKTNPSRIARGASGEIRQPRAAHHPETLDFVTNDSQSRERMGFDTDELERFFELMPNGWVEDPQITAEREQELARITKHLPRHLKATLFLCERDGMTYEEAGKKLGKSPNTVKKWLADARAHCQVRANRR
jgi:DNA-directed RNA polymerase specialized sigma24 family protein